MAREGLDLDGERAHLPHTRAVHVDAGAHELRSAHPAAAHAPDRGGQRADRIFGQSEDLADLADGGAAAIGDDGRGNAGMAATVVLVNVLDHLLAPLMLEIDVDVGWLAAVRGDETFEQEAALARVDVGDAQAVADRRVGRGAAALTQDVLAPRVTDDVMDGEKIRRVIELGDERQFMIERLADIVRNALGIARGRALLGRREARAHFLGIFITQLIQREGQCRIERRCFFDRSRRIAEEARHLGGRLEIALGIDGKAASRGVDRQVLANAGEHVLQFPPVGMVIEHVVDGDERHAGLAGDRGAPGEPRAVIAAIEHVGGEPHAAAGGGAQEREEIACVRFFLRTCDQPKPGLWPGLRRGGEGNGRGCRRRLS